MLQIHCEDRLDGRCRHHAVLDGSDPLPVGRAMALLQTDDAFTKLLTSQLADSPFQAFRWETPPLTSATLHRPFEFVLMDSPGLDRVPDLTAFQSHFTHEPVVSFENLGGDAMMVVPCPQAPPRVYVHLAAFLRNAPAAQIRELWRRVGAAVMDRVSDRPLWLSTAGGGVAWLHVRLDSRPKYYSYPPYRLVD